MLNSRIVSYYDRLDTVLKSLYSHVTARKFFLIRRS